MNPRSILTALVAPAAILAMLTAAPADAATRLGMANEFVDSSGAVSFSISLTASSGVVGTHDIGSPAGGWSTDSSSGIQRGSNDTLPDGASLTTSGGASGGSIGGISSASMRSGVFTLTDKGSRSHSAASLVVGNTASPVRSLEVLWTTVSGSVTVKIGGVTFDSAEFVAAAAELGITDTSSLYITFNGLEGVSVNSLSVSSGPAAANKSETQFQAISYGSENNYWSRDAYTPPGVPGEPEAEGPASPAPLPALGGTIPGAVAALVAFRRRRKNRVG